MKSIHAKHRARGKNHRQALGAVMHRMPRVIWGMLTSEKPYDRTADAANLVKNTNKAQANEERRPVEKEGRSHLTGMLL